MAGVPRIEFRPLTDADLPTLFEWMNRSHVAQWWDGPISYDEVLEKYGSRIHSDSIRPYLVLLDGSPGGYIQSWIAAQMGEGWWEPETDPGVIGIDQFLADAGRLSQGIGTAMVTQFVRRLFRDPTVTRVQLDAEIENFRAIRCYEKVGFQRHAIAETPEGPVLLLRLHRGSLP